MLSEPQFRAGDLAIVVCSDDPNVRVGQEVMVMRVHPFPDCIFGFDYEIEVPGTASRYVCRHRCLKRRPPPPIAKVDWMSLCKLTPRQTEIA